MEGNEMVNSLSIWEIYVLIRYKVKYRDGGVYKRKAHEEEEPLCYEHVVPQGAGKYQLLLWSK